MAEKSDFCKGPSIIWKTTRNFDYENIVSSSFSILGTTWRLEITSHFYTSFTLRLCRIECIKPQVQFSAITSLQNSRDVIRDYFSLSLSHKAIITSDKTVLWTCNLETAPYKIHSFKDWKELTIICTFTDIPSSMSGFLNETVEVTTQTDFDRILPLKTPDDDKLSSDESEEGASCVSSNLDSLSRDLSKLLQDKVLPDITLRCGDRTVAAHKAVLAARSKVFTAMFQSKMSESETGVVEITDIDVQVLDLFLKYLYTGRLFESSHEVLLSLYAASEKYAVTALTMECCEHLINNLTQENCFSFLSMADAHSNQEFKNAIFNFILNHMEIIASDEWKTFDDENQALSHEVLQMIVKQKYLK